MAIVVVFFLSYAPFHAERIMVNTIPDSSWTKRLIHYHEILWTISGIFFYGNSIFNPCIYSLMSLKFRKALRTVLWPSCCRRFRMTTSSSSDNRARYLLGMHYPRPAVQACLRPSPTPEDCVLQAQGGQVNTGAIIRLPHSYNSCPSCSNARSSHRSWHVIFKPILLDISCRFFQKISSISDESSSWKFRFNIFSKPFVLCCPFKLFDFKDWQTVVHSVRKIIRCEKKRWCLSCPCICFFCNFSAGDSSTAKLLLIQAKRNLCQGGNEEGIGGI